jgi:hypothetical protein
VVAFVTAKRSTTDFEALDARWARCKCSQTDVRNHSNAAAIHTVVSILETPYRIVESEAERGQGIATGRFGNKIDMLGAVFRNFVHFLDNALDNLNAKAFSVARGRHPEIWPATPKDVIPYGAKIFTRYILLKSDRAC